jgi:hypothetical protein
LLTVPSLSKAAATSGTLAGAVKIALLIGAVRLTVGGKLGGGLTVTLTGLEVVMTPELSMALAVKLYVPTGTFNHVKT